MGQGTAARTPPNIAGDALLQDNYVARNGTATILCYPPRNITAYDPDILNDYDGENADSNVTGILLARRGLYYVSEIVAKPELDPGP